MNVPRKKRSTISFFKKQQIQASDRFSKEKKATYPGSELHTGVQEMEETMMMPSYPASW